jgi:radical SAM superfamily enzyme YgiQ (UPF0313 family)
VLAELGEQSCRHGTRNFIFLDLKLNSSPALLRGLAEHVQRVVPGAEWIGTVHVDQRRDNGLSRQELNALVRSGMRRVSFGLESGSQRVLDLLDKGCTVENNAAFIHDAHEAGLSVRCTMFTGYPGETASDLDATADFLRRHGKLIDRVRFNDFSIHEQTPVYDTLRSNSARFPQIRVKALQRRRAAVSFKNTEVAAREYRRARGRALAQVYAINRRPLRVGARAFDGLM